MGRGWDRIPGENTKYEGMNLSIMHFTAYFSLKRGYHRIMQYINCRFQESEDFFIFNWQDIGANFMKI